MARIDDVINTAGHRLSTGQLEEIISNHESIAECAVIGVKDAIKGEVPIALVVLKSGVSATAEDIEREVVKKVRDDIGAVASLKTVVLVSRLPKTRSGKIIRGTIKKIAENQKYAFPSTIEVPETLEEVKIALEGKGLARDIGIQFEEDLGKTPGSS